MLFESLHFQVSEFCGMRKISLLHFFPIMLKDHDFIPVKKKTFKISKTFLEQGEYF